MSAHEQERLSAFLDGELAPSERAEVEAHLAECETCAAFVAQLRAVEEAARSLPTSVPEGYFDRLPARVRARIEERRRVGGSLPAWAWAAALLLAVVTPLSLRQLRSPQAEPQAPPAVIGPQVPSGTAGDSSRAAAPAPTVAPMPTRRPEQPAASALAKRQDHSFAPEPADNAPEVGATGKARAGREEGPAKLATAPAESKARAGERARDSAQDEGLAAGVEGGVSGAVAERDAAGVAPPGAALQESVRDRMQAPAMVAVAPPVGSIAEAPSSPAARATASQEGDPAEAAFRRLAATRPHTVQEWRNLREDWRQYAASFPDGPHADEARVRTIEAGLEAWKTGGAAEDAAVFRRDRGAYLERPDALQSERVRKLR